MARLGPRLRERVAGREYRRGVAESVPKWASVAIPPGVMYTKRMTVVDVKQVAVRMSAEDLGVLHDLQAVLGIRSQSEIFRMALRSLAKEHAIPAKKQRSTGDAVKGRRP